MSTATRFVQVVQLPYMPNPYVSQAFLAGLRRQAEVSRPRFVLDCSSIQKTTVATVEMMLLVLEEALKGNGDLRLAGLNAEGAALLERSGAARLFESFATVELAVSSYRRAASLAPLGGVDEVYEELAAA